MIDWSYGILQSSLQTKNERFEWEINPIYVNPITVLNKKGVTITIKGKGKITQVSFNSDSKSATLVFAIDGGIPSKVNNGYCLTNLCDTRGIGCFQIQEIQKNRWRYTCLIPTIFDKEIGVVILNEGHESKDIKIEDLHIYYLVPKEVTI